MKREDLRAIQGLTEEQIEEIMRLHGQDETAHQTALQAVQAQLDTARQGLAAFDGVNVTELQERISQLQSQLDAQAAQYNFQSVLTRAAHEAGALDAEDVIALLPERTALQQSQNQTEDIQQALAALRTRKPYLFRPEPVGSGQPQPGPDTSIVIPKPRAGGGPAQPDLAEFLAMSSTERLALRTRNPALFQQLSAQIRATRV